MGEARRRMRVAAIGAEISWSDDHHKAAIRQPKFITRHAANRMLPIRRAPRAHQKKTLKVRESLLSI